MSGTTGPGEQADPEMVDFIRIFGRIGLLSFGGPAAQIALMHRELVEDRPWLSDREFLSALSFCMLLPGPEAMQLATYSGWKQRGVAGGMIAGGLFVLPGAIVILCLALIYAKFGQVPLMQALFLGIKATVIVIVLQALMKVSRKALVRPMHWVISLLSFIGIFALQMPFPVIIAVAGLWGALTAHQAEDAHPVQNVSHSGTLGTVAIWLAAWLMPLGLLAAFAPTMLADIAIFFSKLAVVTFGGAYAVLAYMTQEVVQGFSWLNTAEMMDGLGLAETTPGPLILVTEFVGFLAGYREAGLVMGIVAAGVTLWMTFIPCFLWIFAGAPYLEWISAQPRLAGALDAITAAVVGVILNLSIWFAVHVFFREVTTVDVGPITLIWPRFATLDIAAVSLATIAAVLLLRLKLPLPVVLAVLAALGVLVGTLFGGPLQSGSNPVL